MSATSSPEADVPQALASDLCWLLTRASQMLTGEFTRALGASGISPRQHMVLAAATGAEHTQTDLARIVGLDKTTMMVTLDELERAGLAQRRPMPSDRRARIVAVTEAGSHVLKDADAVLERVREEVLSLMPADQRDCFLNALMCLACSDSAEATGCRAPRRARSAS